MTPKVLIVEDEYIVAADIKSILNCAGFAGVETADCPETALAVSEEFQPDIALIDISLDDDVDGIELAGKLKKNRDIPFIFITAFSETGVVEKARSVSPYGYLLKPIRKQDLLIAIEMGMQRFKFENAIKEKADDVKSSEKQFRKVFEASPIGIALYDSTWHLVHVNQSFLDIFNAENVEELYTYDFFKNIKININDISKLNKGASVRYEIPFDFSLQNAGEPGSKKTIHIDFIISPMDIDPETGPEWYLLQVQDITGRKQEEENLVELATIDPLTSAFNRRGFVSMAGRQIEIARRSANDLVLVFIDLDKMKLINDSYGHKAGDKALEGAYQILKNTFRTSDLIARWGGDEFIVLMINSLCDEHKKISARLSKNAELYCKKNNFDFNISMSIGMVKFDPEDDSDIEKVIEKADQVMYENKKLKTPVLRIS